MPRSLLLRFQPLIKSMRRRIAVVHLRLGMVTEQGGRIVRI
jgi:hypothetical protein